MTLIKWLGQIGVNTFFSVFTLCLWQKAYCGEENYAARVECNDLFINLYSRVLANGKTMVGIVEPSGKGWPVKSVQQLPLSEKYRFALLYFLAFNIDGEGSHQLMMAMGTDWIKVGRVLKKISDQDFLRACQNLGVPGSRLKIFRKVVNAWAVGKR